jgi:FdhD protein
VSIAVVMRTPGHDEELALGFLVSERVIDDVTQVVAVRHCTTVASPEAEDNIMLVTLRDDVELDLARLKRNLFAGSSCGVCGKATLESALLCAAPLVDDVRVTASVLYALPDRLRSVQAAFDLTGGLHGVGLFDRDGTLRVVREDVGRHNAVDKVVGSQLQAQASVTSSILLVSGRVSFEVVQKAAAARIPIVAGISAPTSLAVDLADTLGITLVGFLRGRSCNVYAHPARILDA